MPHISGCDFGKLQLSGFKTDKQTGKKKQTVGMRDKEGGTERNNSLVGRMKTKAEEEISLLSGLRECGEEEKKVSAGKNRQAKDGVIAER